MEVNNAMREQALSIPELLEQQYQYLEPKTRSIMSFEEIFSVQNIIITGCGDSKFVGMAAKYTFEELTGMRTEVMSAIELSRYFPAKRLGNAPNNPLVIAVSKSGSVARVGEAAQRAKEHGAFVLGITSNEDSPVGQNSSRILKLDIPKFPSAPGVRGYLVNLLALQLLAVRFAEVRGKITMDKANQMRKEIKNLPSAMRETMSSLDSQMLNLAYKWKDIEAYDFVGVGQDEAAALYGQAKVFEALGKYASEVNTEEFMHLNCFQRNTKKIGTVVVCSSSSPALSRAKEVIHSIVNNLERPTLVITDDENTFDIPRENVCVVPKLSFSQNNAFVMFWPIAFLMADIMALLGEESGRGLQDYWSFCKNGAGIKNSKIVII